MGDFTLWFGIGVEHIVSLEGYDHILFIMLLAFTFPVKEWKKLLVLITAFTLGHSLSLALSANKILTAPRLLTEWLIACTILFTAIYQLVVMRRGTAEKQKGFLYGTVTLFGLIHGLGFSFALSAMLGKAESLTKPLLYFNLGLEAGQLFIIILVILFSLLLTALFKWPFGIYKQISLCIIAIIALKLCGERSLEFFRS